MRKLKRRLVTATLILGLASGIAASRILAAEINGDVGDLLRGMREKAGSMPAPNSKPLAALPSQPMTKACFCETGRLTTLRCCYKNSGQEYRRQGTIWEIAGACDAYSPFLGQWRSA